MRGVSFFSGIGGLDLGAELAGVPIDAQCEPVEYRQRVLAAHFDSVIYPDVRELEPGVFADPRGGGRFVYDPAVGWSAGEGNSRRAAGVEHAAREGQRDVPGVGAGADLLVGGFPCQDLSVAGKRKGLGGGRSGLYWEIVRLLRAAGPVRPRYVLLENVPGLLSSCSCRGCRKCGALLRWHRERGCPGDPNRDSTGGPDDVFPFKCAACDAARGIRKRHAGTDFAVVCAALANLGYRVSYRILDSRHFGVAQRRRRVFMFAELDPGADGRPEVLLEPEGGAGDPLASGSPWEGAAAALAGRARERGDGERGAVGGVHGFGVGGPEDDDLSAPLGTFGNTGGHRQDLDSAGAYVVAGPDGDDLSHAIGAANPNRHDPTFQTYVSEVSKTLTGQVRNESNPTGELHVVEVRDEAATLTSAHNNEGVNPAGRRAEDDVNLVAYSVTPGEAPGSAQARETDTADTLTASDDKKTGSGTLVTPINADALSRTGDAERETVDADGAVRKRPPGLGVGEAGDPSFSVTATKPPAVAIQQTPQGDVNEDTVSPPVLGRGGSVGNNTPMVATGFNPTGGTRDVQAEDEIAPTLRVGSGVEIPSGPAVVVHENADGKVYESDEAPALRGNVGRDGSGTPFVVADDEAQVTAVSENQRREVRESDHAPALGTPSGHPGQGLPMVFTKTHGAQDADDDPELWDRAEVSHSLDSLQHARDVVVEPPAVRPGAAVRRLTPVECARLQGFPDGWCDVDPGGTADGPQYAGLGDAVTVPVPRWVIARLLRREELERGGAPGPAQGDHQSGAPPGSEV